MEFILGIIALSTLGWLGNNWIRAKHGYDLEDEWGGKSRRKEEAEGVAALREENRTLRDTLARLEKRTATLETIVTDSSYGVASQIEALRGPTSDGGDHAGVPFEIASKERV